MKASCNINDSATTSNSVELHELHLSDLDALLDWRIEVLETVFADAEPWDRDALRQANRAYYQRQLDEGHVACIALVDGKGAGCGAICLQEEMPSPDNPSGKCAYLMNIYTRPEFRHQGVAGEIVDWLVDQARTRGAEKIYLESTEMAAPLYREKGFQPMEGMMKLEMEERS